MDRPQAVFFGSGPVALESFRQLVDVFAIEAIVTKSITQHEMQVAFPGIPILTANNRAELDSLIDQQNLMSTFGILIDFGIIVSEHVIQAFPKGIINSHFSLLPEWRGADPITFAILSGQKMTGASLMLISAGLDEGLLVAQEAYQIPTAATTATLTRALIGVSTRLLHTVVPKYLTGKLIPYPQSQGLLGKEIAATYSRKLTKQDGAIDWDKPAATLEREIRAFQGWPGSYTQLAGKDVTITVARIADRMSMPGKTFVEDKKLYVGCGEQSLEIINLKPAGKKEMSASAFLAGYWRLLST